MESSTIKFAIIVCIMLSTIDGTNCKIKATCDVFNKTNSLLESLNNTSTTMMSTLQQLATTQVQMSQTDTSTLNKLNEIGKTYSEMSQTDTSILNKLNEIGETQSEMSQTDASILSELNEMANSFNQVVTLLQMQNQQLQNLTELMTSQVIKVNVQKPPLHHQDLPYDCLDLASREMNTSGVYKIKPRLSNFTVDVYCDMVTDGGGWTIFQRRFNGEVDFYRNWTEYEQGFGDVNGEHWVGLDLLHLLTLPAGESGDITLRIDLGSFDNETAYAEYQSFSVGDSASNYVLTIGSYSGNAGDSLGYHDRRQFSTYDRENEGYNCAQDWQGAWWYNNCQQSNLNGLYLGPIYYSGLGMNWYYWKGLQSLKSSTMMLRRNQ